MESQNGSEIKIIVRRVNFLVSKTKHGSFWPENHAPLCVDWVTPSSSYLIRFSHPKHDIEGD